MSFDHWQYAFVGDTIMAGGAPYRNAWDLKGPLNYYIFGWVRSLLGRSEGSIRLVDLLVIVPLFSWQLHSLHLKLGGKRFGAALAVLLFLIFYFGCGYNWTAEPDDWAAMLILVSVSLLLNTTRTHVVNTIYASVAIALAILLKPTYLIFSPLLLLPPSGFEISSKENVLRFLLGSTVMMFIVSAFYVWALRHGGLRELIDAYSFVRQAYPHDWLSYSELKVFLDLLSSVGFVIPYALAPVGLYLILRTGRVATARMLSVWFLLGILMVIYQNVYWLYELTAACIPAVVTVSLMVDILRERVSLGFPKWRHPLDSIVLLFVGYICLSPTISATFFSTLPWPAYALRLSGTEDYSIRLTDVQEHRKDIESIAKYLTDNTAINDKVQGWGWRGGCEILLAKRQLATRFSYAWAMIEQTSLKEHYREIFLQELSISQPKVILVEIEFPSPVNDFPQFSRFLSDHYKIAGTVGLGQVWIRKGPIVVQNNGRLSRLVINSPPSRTLN
jgi:hypothetical protein